ncbi:tryptophan 7-halogenase [Pseudonocardia eucalypti]|uniref:Tryptophan 7-halogenase n=1 Tax=Pseudonocardia eucalypti TaxID=648755 RepID=A0ABP9QFS1_9PSEU|nr:tryptophan halogenase [Pseudonocardia eucalypti]
MGNRVEKVIILGGGTAGWMTASYLAKMLGETTSVTVLESPGIPKIGVGEATVPNLQRVFFDFLGLEEKDWMPECNASFKMAIKYINWCTGGDSRPDSRTMNGGFDHFYHTFGLLPEHDGLPLSHYWAYRRLLGETKERFDQYCFWEPAAMDAKKAPCWPDGQPATYYAWHFDAHLVADFLRRFSTDTLGVRHVQDELWEVRQDSQGFIQALITKSGQELAGDLFVDCSGFRGLLINKAMGEPFIDMSGQLLCDSAVATAVPHNDDDGIEPYTSAIAMNSGWTWKIPMLGRFGTGYVYSSAFIDQDEATSEFCRLWDIDPEELPLSHIRFRTGRNRRAWVKNCIGIGLASCFLEPLESVGIYFITGAIYQLAKHFPDKSFNPLLIDRCNAEIKFMFDDCRDFLQAHYYLSPRVDTPFWQATKELDLTPEIQEKIAMYKAGLPINAPVVDESTYYTNFDAEFRNFWTNGSYYCVFAGLGLLPDTPVPSLANRPSAQHGATRLFENIRRKEDKMLSELPTTVEYLRALHKK